MAATTAQEEFDMLVSSKERVSRHPEDASEDSNGDNDSDTLVDSTTQKSKSKSSLRSGPYDGADSSDADSDSEVRLQRRRPSTYSLPRNYSYNANTGPKGVIADAQAFELEKGIGNKRTYVRTEDFVLPKNQRVASKKDLRSGRGARADEDDEDDDVDEADDGGGLGEGGDDEDDEVIRKWREMRVVELKKNMSKRQGGGRSGRYGTLQTVDAMGFLDAVELVPKSTVVVVYVFDDELPISDAYQTHIATLASKYSDVRFIALHFEEAEMEHAGIPAILAYKDGDQFAGLVPLKDEAPFTRDIVSNLEEAFKRHGIL